LKKYSHFVTEVIEVPNTEKQSLHKKLFQKPKYKWMHRDMLAMQHQVTNAAWHTGVSYGCQRVKLG